MKMISFMKVVWSFLRWSPEASLWWGCFHEGGLCREGSLMNMISLMKVVWSFFEVVS